MRISRFVKGSADKSHVIGGTATAARLRHKYSELVSVVPSRRDCLHKLTDDGDRRKTSVIIDVFQPCIYCLAVIVFQYFKIISVLVKYRLDNIKVDRQHLRRENGIVLVPHLLRIFGTVICGWLRLCLDILLTAHPHSRYQAANTDTNRTEIVHLVDLQNRIELIASFKYFVHLIGSHRIQSATEGIELYQLHIVTASHEFSSSIKP